MISSVLKDALNVPHGCCFVVLLSSVLFVFLSFSVLLFNLFCFVVFLWFLFGLLGHTEGGSNPTDLKDL